MPRIQGNFQTCQACQEDCHTCQATGHKHGRNDYTSSDMNLTTAHRVWLKQIDQPKSDTATSPNTAPATQSVTDKVRWKHVKRPLHCATDPRRSETVLNMIRDQTRHRQPLTFNTSGSWNWDFFPLLCLSVTLFFLIRLGSFPTQLPFDHWLHGLQLFSKFVSSHQGIWSLAPVFDFAMPRFGELLPKNVEMALKPSALRVHWTAQMLRKGVSVLRCLFWCWVLMASLFTLSAPWQSTGDRNIFQKCFLQSPFINLPVSAHPRPSQWSSQKLHWEMWNATNAVSRLEINFCRLLQGGCTKDQSQQDVQYIEWLWMIHTLYFIPVSTVLYQHQHWLPI